MEWCNVRHWSMQTDTHTDRQTYRQIDIEMTHSALEHLSSGSSQPAGNSSVLTMK